MTGGTSILLALLRDYHRAIETPSVAKALICSQEITDPSVRAACRELILANGNWQQARRALAATPRPGTSSLIQFADQSLGQR